MAKVYADLIRKGLKTFSQVPNRIKDQVRKVLMDEGLEVLIKE